MAINKTIEILQQQIDRLNQEQTENKWNEKDKKLFEKFLGLVHDDPFRIFYADGGEVHRILELVYPETVKEKIEELFRIKYIYDGYLKYGDVVKPQIEVERPNLEILIKDISDHYLEVYRKQKKEKENALRQCRTVLDKMNKQLYITMEDCELILSLADTNEQKVEDKVVMLSEVLENNNSAIQAMLKKKTKNKVAVEDATVKEAPKVVKEKVVEETPIVPEVQPIIPMIEPKAEITVESKEEIPLEKKDESKPEENEILKQDQPVEESKEEIEMEVAEEPIVEETEHAPEESCEENYLEQYIKALEEIDPNDIPAIHYALPKYHMPNFKEIMELLVKAIKEQIEKIKAEEQTSEVKKVRVLREEISRAQQLLKTITAYMEKQEKAENVSKEKIVDGEEIQLLLLENEEGESLIEKDFQKQLRKEQYGIAMELFRCLERFSDPMIRKKAKPTSVPGIQELTEAGVHIFFEPFAENTYIVIALLAEKNGYLSWLEDKLRLRHGLFQKQEKGMQRRWNQHGTRNTMLLGSETAYLEMQDMAEKR